MDKFDDKAADLLLHHNNYNPAVLAQWGRDIAAEAWGQAGDMAATYGAPVMRDDAERGFYVACENLRDEYRKRSDELRKQAAAK